jgi:hypothetical protein
MLGEHTRELLREYGYAESDIDGFITAGVAAVPAAAPSRAK